MIEVIGGIRVPTCDCPQNTGGKTCRISSCGSGLLCYNGACGGVDNAICQCDQENGQAKYHGESCDMPAACHGNPCQNGGTCSSRSQADNTQVRFTSSVQLITSELCILEIIHDTATKPNKIFECSCAEGFTGTFCEFKTEQDHLLFVSTTVNDFENRFNDKLVFNANGRLIEEDASIGEDSGAYRSCSTMLNGEAIVLGGNHEYPTNINRQVHFKSILEIIFTAVI